jgi:hypothetical protein
LPAIRDLADGLFPGDSCPAALPFLANSSERIKHPIGMVDVVEIGTDLGTQPASGDWVVGVASEADGSAILDLSDYPTGVRAVVRTGTTNLQGKHGTFSPAESNEQKLQTADCRAKASSGQPGEGIMKVGESVP